MQLYTVHVDITKWGKRPALTRVVTKCIEVAAIDMLTACDKAVEQAGGGAVSMIWPKTVWRNVAGTPRLFTCLTTGEVQLGKK